MRLAVLAFVLTSSLARADEPAGRNLVYGELLGKAGEYGIGFEHQIAPRLALGAAGSFAVVRGQQIATGAAYVHVTALARGHHAMFGELGAILAHSRVPSPVADWTGMSDTGGGGFASLGYEHARRRLVLRFAGSVVVGEGGVGPAVGLAIGVRP